MSWAWVRLVSKRSKWSWTAGTELCFRYKNGCFVAVNIHSPLKNHLKTCTVCGEQSPASQALQVDRTGDGFSLLKQYLEKQLPINHLGSCLLSAAGVTGVGGEWQLHLCHTVSNSHSLPFSELTDKGQGNRCSFPLPVAGFLGALPYFNSSFPLLLSNWFCIPLLRFSRETLIFTFFPIANLGDYLPEVHLDLLHLEKILLCGDLWYSSVKDKRWEHSWHCGIWWKSDIFPMPLLSVTAGQEWRCRPNQLPLLSLR